MASEPGSGLEREFWLLLRDAGLPEPLLQFQPLAPRRWRVDFCWLPQRLICEVEGGLYQAASGHRSFSGVVRDIEKSNELCLAGYRLLRVTSAMIEDGSAVELVRRALGQD